MGMATFMFPNLGDREHSYTEKILGDSSCPPRLRGSKISNRGITYFQEIIWLLISSRWEYRTICNLLLQD
jgi:hypothetical protein